MVIADATWDEVFGLLALHWPRLPVIVEQARAHGADWRALSRPFGVRVDGELVAHAGVWTLPDMIIDGTASAVAGIHAVCTRPEHHRRGYARAALEAAVAHAETLAPRQLLFAVEPRVYTGLGFRRCAPQRFELGFARTIQPPSPTAGPAPQLRRLELDDADQRERLRALCRVRAPLSDRLGVRDGGDLLILDELLGTRGAGGRLWWLGDDAVVAGELLDDELHLYDLVCASHRPLAELVLGWPGRIRRVYVYWDATSLALGDALTHQLAPGERLRPRPILAGDVPMLRGPTCAAEAGFALSPLASC